MYVDRAVLLLPFAERSCANLIWMIISSGFPSGGGSVVDTCMFDLESVNTSLVWQYCWIDYTPSPQEDRGARYDPLARRKQRDVHPHTSAGTSTMAFSTTEWGARSLAMTNPRGFQARQRNPKRQRASSEDPGLSAGRLAGRIGAGGDGTTTQRCFGGCAPFFQAVCQFPDQLPHLSACAVHFFSFFPWEERSCHSFA